MSNIWQSISGFPLFLLYFATSVALLVLFVAIYMRVMPHRELALIREGNVAAALSLSGALIGFVLPLASAVAHSVNPVDMVVWGSCAVRPARRLRRGGATGAALPRGNRRRSRRASHSPCRAGCLGGRSQRGVPDVLRA